MLLWIQRNLLKSTAYFALAGFLGFGGLDLAVNGPASLIPAAILAIGLFTSRLRDWSAVIAIAVAAAANIFLDVKPGFSGGITLVAIAMVAAFGSRLWALITLGASVLAGIALVSKLVFFTGLSVFDVSTYGANASLNVALFGYGLVISTSAAAFLIGRLAITLTTHVGTSFDQVVSSRERTRLQLEIAEQNARFEIAKDISELVIQRLTAAVSLADGASFALRGESELAERTLGQVSQSARQAHIELRRLYDMLNKLDKVNAAPPGIADLEPLVPLYRELGYNIMLNHLGKKLELEEGLELAIYRIVFDALENIQSHVPRGADVTIDFIWSEGGLQVLVKDNGVEVANRSAGLTAGGYGVDEDQKALVETITGAGITAMRERAGLYRGSIEATRVPGVGFTVSAIFPELSR
jgi:signal transduction histidine kinase